MSKVPVTPTKACNVCLIPNTTSVAYLSSNMYILFFLQAELDISEVDREVYNETTAEFIELVIIIIIISYNYYIVVYSIVCYIVILDYRPIALTSCVCKTMDGMINKRFVWFLESNNIKFLSNIQCGFRKNRSTIDHLVRLETYQRRLLNKEHAVSIFFGLEKAYDTTWKYDILRDLHNIGLKGHFPNFIQNFLSNRHFNVRLGYTISDNFDQDMGVPKGSILSVTLFSLKIYCLATVLKNDTLGRLYVDDFVLCYKSKNMNSIE